MKNIFKFLGLVLVAALVSYAVAQKTGAPAVSIKETAFERVLRTNTLRCGYYVFPPVTLRDINTNELSGFSVDMLNLIAERTGLKVEWTEEVNFANWTEGLQAGRFDAVCTPMWPDAPLGRVALFTRPMFYAAISPLVRADDNRFATLADMNKPEVSFVGQDNSMLTGLTKEAFPNAQLRLMPPTMDGPTVVQEVVARKADAILLDWNGVLEYNKRNDVKLKMISRDQPVKAQGFTLLVAQNELALHAFLDNAVADLLAVGSINRLLTKWEPEPGTYIRAAVPYRLQP
jgi:polar amino acid transport system substrate-binding protein